MAIKFLDVLGWVGMVRHFGNFPEIKLTGCLLNAETNYLSEQTGFQIKTYKRTKVKCARHLKLRSLKSRVTDARFTFGNCHVPRLKSGDAKGEAKSERTLSLITDAADLPQNRKPCLASTVPSHERNCIVVLRCHRLMRYHMEHPTSLEVITPSTGSRSKTNEISDLGTYNCGNAALKQPSVRILGAHKVQGIIRYTAVRQGQPDTSLLIPTCVCVCVH